MQVETGLTTFFPRPEEIVSATREMERGRRPKEDVNRLNSKWTREVMKLEEQMGLTWVTGGHLSWQDIFRPLIESSHGMAPGALTRWFETNTFYRRPVVEGPPELVKGAFLRFLPQSGRDLAVILPGPFTFSHLVDNKTSMGEGELSAALSSFLARLVEELSGNGIKTFILHEPLLAREEDPREEELLRLYGPLGEALSSKRSLIWSYFGNGSDLLRIARKLPVNGVGVDLGETPLSGIMKGLLPKNKTLGLGCIDSRTSLPEDSAELSEILHGLESVHKVDSVILGPGAPMDLLPWDTAVTKLDVIPQAVKRFRAS